jgi:hypothetical protein
LEQVYKIFEEIKEKLIKFNNNKCEVTISSFLFTSRSSAIIQEFRENGINFKTFYIDSNLSEFEYYIDCYETDRVENNVEKFFE